MPRLTITLSNERHRALKETAASRGMTIGALVEESLDRAGVKTRASAEAILARARSNAASTVAGMTEDEVTQWAVDEVRAHRDERAQQESDARRQRDR